MCSDCPSGRICEVAHDWYDPFSFREEPDFDNPPGWFLTAGKITLACYYCREYLRRRPDILEVSTAYQWREKGALALRFPVMTLEFMLAIDSFSAGVSQQQADSIDKARREAERSRSKVNKR